MPRRRRSNSSEEHPVSYLDDQALTRDLNRQRMLAGLTPIAIGDPVSEIQAPTGVKVDQQQPMQVPQYPRSRPGGAEPERYRQDNSLGEALNGMLGGGGGIREMLARLRADQAKRAVPTPSVVRGRDLPPPGATQAPSREPGAAAPGAAAPGQPAAAPSAPAPGPQGGGLESLANERQAYHAQLQANPQLKNELAAITLAEEGGDPTARQALIETVYNRGNAKHIGNISQVMDPRYYEPYRNGQIERARVALQNDPKLMAAIHQQIDDAAQKGTNVSNYATDNASGSVARNSSANQTLTFTGDNKESFFRKDVRPDVHGAQNVKSIADWHANHEAASAPVVAPPADPAQTPAQPQAAPAPALSQGGAPQAALTPQALQEYGTRRLAERSAPEPTTPGNLDPGSQPAVQNADGSISTVRTVGMNLDGKETNLPTVSPDGKILTNDQAVDQYRATGKHLGQYRTEGEASAAAQALHEQEAQQISQAPKGVQPPTAGAPQVTPEMAKAFMGAVKAEEQAPSPPTPPGAQPVLPSDVAPPAPGAPGGPVAPGGAPGALTLPVGNAPIQAIQATQGNPIALAGLMPIPPVEGAPLTTSLTAPQPIGQLWQPPIPWAEMSGWGWGGGGLGGGGFDTGGFSGGGFGFGGFGGE
jgi:hypothetical protein